jgi:hypothetical protein
MRHFLAWFRDEQFTGPWLIVGKGPTYNRIHEVDLSSYRILALNHVAREIRCDVAHMIDIDVWTSCSEKIVDNARVVVFPMHPHVNECPTQKTITEFRNECGLLQYLDFRRRLLWYQHSVAIVRGLEIEGDQEWPVVRVEQFSAEAAVHLLGLAGVKTIRTLGVDGGMQMAQRFSDMPPRTRPYDAQWLNIRRSIQEFGLDYAPIFQP